MKQNKIRKTQFAVSSAYVNNSQNLKNESVRDDRIKLRMIKPHVDRIQLSLKNRGKSHRRLREALLARFKQIRVYSVEKRFVRQFKHGAITFELIYYRENSYWCALSMSDPTAEFQVMLREILERLDIAKYASVSQVEFALDLFPVDSADLYALGVMLSQSIVLRHARMGQCGRNETTFYRGNGGNVRRGSKGITCYPKVEDNCYRIELRANRGLLRNQGFTLNRLPILPEHLNIFDHFEFRRGLDSASLHRLIQLISKKRRPNSNRSSSIANVARLRAIEHMILDYVNEHGACFQDIDLWFSRPVAEQIDYFHELRRTYGISNQVDEYFPKRFFDEFVDIVENSNYLVRSK